MAKIVLREDDWFDAGKEVKDRRSFAYMTYKVRQKLKQKLVKLSKRNLSRNALEKALCGINAPRLLKIEGLYLYKDSIFTYKYGMPGEIGEIYLGCITE